MQAWLTQSTEFYFGTNKATPRGLPCGMGTLHLGGELHGGGRHRPGSERPAGCVLLLQPGSLSHSSLQALSVSQLVQQVQRWRPLLSPLSRTHSPAHRQCHCYSVNNA